MRYGICLMMVVIARFTLVLALVEVELVGRVGFACCVLLFGNCLFAF